MSVFTIARLTFLEAARRKILLAAVGLGLVFLVIYGIGFYFTYQDVQRYMESRIEMNTIINFLMMAGMYVANFLAVMMTVLTSVDTLSGEIGSGTIQTIMAKPIRRWEVVLGKWLGFAVMLTLYLLLIGGGIMLVVYMFSGYTPNNPFQGLGLMLLNMLLLLSVTLAGGSALSTLANGVLVFGMYGVAFIGGWIEQIGTFLPNQETAHTARNIGVITSLVLPSEALWKRAAFEMQSPLLRAMGPMTPFFGGSYPSGVMIAYSALYLLAILVYAMYLFSKRDL